MFFLLIKMNILHLFLSLFFLLIVFPINILVVVASKAATADGHGCPISNCSHDGPLIHLPFRLKHHPLHCGHAEFEVFCLKNMTMIQLSSSSGLFPIQTIDYENQYFKVYDPDGCLPKRLLNFTISRFSTRHYFFQSDSTLRQEAGIYPMLPKLTLLNCSTAQNFSTPRSFNYLTGHSVMPIRCLSDPGHHQVLATPPSTSLDDLPVSTCGTLIKEISLPLRCVIGNGPLYCELDNVLFLGWNWEYFPACQNCTSGWCRFNNSSNQLECHDPYIFQDPLKEPKGHASTTKSVIIGVSITSCSMLISVAVVAIFYHVKQSRRIEEKENQMKIEKFLNDHKSHVPTRYSYADIKKMTNGFKKKLGQGGFGSVFRGMLPNGVLVAVKVLNDSKGNGEDFVNEVGTIGRIHHVNVVRLLGFSAESGKRAVIYELMPNRSLEKFITSFAWEKLHNIITGIAKGIEYLHQGCEQRILHFDIKPHNILLDHDFNPKISDFGLAKLCSKEESIISMTAARGTVGYIAPEVFNGNFGTVSYKSDVYSFGMLVLEMIGARKETAHTCSNSEVYFPELIYNHLIQGETLDLDLDTDEDAQIAKRLVIVALWCIQWYPVNRPSMKAVVRMLEGASESLIMPPNPFASTSTQADQPRTVLSS